uniref:Uncharacterized protein n=1 Tax=Heterorhabditis bacteriophora TaxID=37862 RepID=A0A1I7WAI9_HETBA
MIYSVRSFNILIRKQTRILNLPSETSTRGHMFSWRLCTEATSCVWAEIHLARSGRKSRLHILASISKSFFLAPRCLLNCFSKFSLLFIKISVVCIGRPSNNSAGDCSPGVAEQGDQRYACRNVSIASYLPTPSPSNFFNARLNVSTNFSTCPFD